MQMGPSSANDIGFVQRVGDKSCQRHGIGDCLVPFMAE